MVKKLGIRIGLAVLVMAALSPSANRLGGQETEKAVPLPPLTVSKDAPLLLEETPAAKDTGSGGGTKIPPGRRLMCYDCHVNYFEEQLAAVHAEKAVTCVDCHGASEAHKNDESNTTPPQIMYPRETIDAKCRECHKTHDAAAAAVIARWQDRGLQKLGPAELACTDCHGSHRLKIRTIRWDKKTRKLLPFAKPVAK